MTDHDFRRLLDMLAGGVIAAQGEVLAANFLARELLVDVARLQPDPERYAAALFDRVIARLDPRSGLPEKKPIALARDLVATIFRDALQALKDDPDRPAPAGTSQH